MSLAHQRQNKMDEGQRKQLIGFNPTSESITLYHQAGDQQTDGTVWEVLITPSGRRLMTLNLVHLNIKIFVKRRILIHKSDLVVLSCPHAKVCGGESTPFLSFMCIKTHGRESSSKDFQRYKTEQAPVKSQILQLISDTAECSSFFCTF